MNKDIISMNSNKLISKHEWIISTLRAMNSLDPGAIGLNEKHFEVL